MKIKAFLLIMFNCILISEYSFSQLYLDPNAPVEQRVSDLLSQMTLEEKIGQMLQTERTLPNLNSVIRDNFLGSVLSGGGSVPGNQPLDWITMFNEMQAAALSTRLKIPILYGIDAVHGNNNVFGATIFPHNIGLGCTRDTLIVRKCAQATASEVKATGLNWTFSPCIAVPRDIRWGRTYEGFGETPELQEMMAGPSVRGYQGNALGTTGGILACAKHFIADGGTDKGINQGNAIVSEANLRKIHLPGYIKAIEAGVGSIMVSFNKWNGVYCHGHSYLVTDLLKNELKFDGIVVSDWEGVKYINQNFKTSIKVSVNAGIDMFMEPYHALTFISNLKALVNEGQVPLSRIDDAVRRILRVKFKMNLFESPYATTDYIGNLGSSNNRAVAREAVRKSLVLLKNNNTMLPLSKQNGKILVAGAKASESGSQCGGWTITWQGSSTTTTIGTTVLDAVKAIRGNENVVYSANGTLRNGADMAVVVVGESPYAETFGDNLNPKLSAADVLTIQNVKQMGIPYVVLLFSGRPILIDTEIVDASAFVACWLPGTEVLGITDVLFGDYPFTGKLSHTWPADIAHEPINWGDVNYNPLFEYGFGLTTNIYSNAAITQAHDNFIIYPTTAKNFITIKSDNYGIVHIFDALGKTILTKAIDINNNQINIQALRQGVYFVKLTISNGKILSSKFIKT